MTEGIKFIEELDAESYAIALADTVKGYEGEGYEVEIKPQIITEKKYDTGKALYEVPHYTALVIAKVAKVPSGRTAKGK
jgi:hypothetical protein|nr:MAG TPA: hypothetical protein [Caudoviricetes sp.]